MSRQLTTFLFNKNDYDHDKDQKRPFLVVLVAGTDIVLCGYLPVPAKQGKRPTSGLHSARQV